MDGSTQMSQPPGRDSFPAERRYRIVDQISSVLLVLALIYWAAFVIFVSPLAFRGQSEDFTTYYAAALALRQHASANIYDLSLLHQVATGRGCPGYFAGYLYPQALAILLEPLTLLPCNFASGFWMLLNVALWLASALLLARWIPSILPANPSAPWNRWMWRGIIVLCLISVPLIDALILGQANFIVLFGLVLVPWLIQRDRPILAGGVLALIALVKVLPAFLILYYAARGRWRVIIGASLSGGLLLVLTLVIVGLPNTLSSFAHLFSWGLDSDPPHNEALAQLPLWLTLSSGGQPDQWTRLLMTLLQGLVALAFGAGVVATLRLRPTRPSLSESGLPRQSALDDMLGYGWATCTMFLLAPLVWFHYNGWLLIPLLCALGVTLRCLPLRQTWVFVCLLAVAAFLITVPLPFDVDNVGIHAQTPVLLGIPLWLVLLLTRPLGTLLLWGILYWLWWRVGSATNALTATGSGSLPGEPRASRSVARQSQRQKSHQTRFANK